MKSVLFLGIVVSALAMPLANEYLSMNQHFAEFTVKYNKRYSNEMEANARFEIFKENFALIANHNNGNHTYSMAINEYADMTWEEFSKSRLGYTPIEQNDQRAINSTFINPQNNVDWRGRLPAVKDQGSCGSCWAFATVASIEFLCGGSLSEQELVDCDGADSGCNGGLPEVAYGYVQSHGLEDESAYPYSAFRGACRLNPSSVRCHIHGFQKTSGEPGLQSAVNQHVVAVGIAAGSPLQFYSGGIFTGGCAAQLNHAVAVVGYGPGYWLVRNSWGGSWGEAGYARFASGSNLCGIADDVTYPY